jgi:YjbE family integral membrane protein
MLTKYKGVDLNLEALTILMSIFILNIVLSGDNAVVIAMASRSLPPKQQKMALILGSSGAIVFRIILTVVIVYLLKIPFLQAIGGILLIFIAVKLVRDEDEGGEYKSAPNLFGAVKIILIADIIMSLDNTLAIAAVCKGDWLMLGIGLATSIPIIIFCSQIILHFMKRFPIIIYIGAGLIAWTAGKMLVEDPKVSLFLEHSINNVVDIIQIAVPIIITVIIIGYGRFINNKTRQIENTH